MDYAFATFYGGDGEMNEFADAARRTVYKTTGENTEVLTATYKGGAAGMYVSRDLRLVAGVVDEFSPGSSGRFTAKAELIAQFGPHPMSTDDMGKDVTEENTLRGTISEFRDGDMDLDFEVTLAQSPIATEEGTAGGETAAMFGSNGPGTGVWIAQLYGPALDSDPTARELRAVPTGVAGRFDALTTNPGDNGAYNSRIVGVFAAEEKK